MTVVCRLELVLDHYGDCFSALGIDGLTDHVHREGSGRRFLTKRFRVDVERKFAIEKFDVVNEPAREVGLFVFPDLPQVDGLDPCKLCHVGPYVVYSVRIIRVPARPDRCLDIPSLSLDSHKVSIAQAARNVGGSDSSPAPISIQRNHPFSSDQSVLRFLDGHSSPLASNRGSFGPHLGRNGAENMRNDAKR